MRPHFFITSTSSFGPPTPGADSLDQQTSSRLQKPPLRPAWGLDVGPRSHEEMAEVGHGAMCDGVIRAFEVQWALEVDGKETEG